MKKNNTRTLSTISLAVMGLNPGRTPIARGLLIGSILLAVPFSLHGAVITLQNAGFESPGTSGYPQATDWSVSSGSAWTALYSQHVAARTPGYDSLGLGLSFGYTIPNATAGARQTVSDTFAANSTYTFKGYGLAATGGNDLRFELGYDNAGTFVSLAAATYDMPTSWTLLDGVSFTTGSSGAELDKNITVRLVGVQTTGSAFNGVWFDNVSLSVLVPEPSTSLLVLLGGTLVIRLLRQREAPGRPNAHMT